jgi:hypothetical protein
LSMAIRCTSAVIEKDGLGDLRLEAGPVPVQNWRGTGAASSPEQGCGALAARLQTISRCSSSNMARPCSTLSSAASNFRFAGVAALGPAARLCFGAPAARLPRLRKHKAFVVPGNVEGLPKAGRGSLALARGLLPATLAPRGKDGPMRIYAFKQAAAPRRPPELPKAVRANFTAPNGLLQC